MSETVKLGVGSREFPVLGYAWSPVYGNVPLVNLPQVSDEGWNKLAEQNAVKNYTQELGHPPRTVKEAVEWQEKWCEQSAQRFEKGKSA